MRRLHALQPREVGAAAADFEQERVLGLSRRVIAQPFPRREIGEPALLGSVDDVDRDAGSYPHTIEKDIGIRGFADGAGRDRAAGDDAVAVHDAAEPSHGADGSIHGGWSDAPR